MNEMHLGLLEYAGYPLRPEGEYLVGPTARVPVVRGIPRFTPDHHYADNFSLLREKHAELQLDSRNGTTERHDLVLRRTNWPQDFFRGKTVLECGCGAGADTEALLDFGANVVAVDLANVDTAKRNLRAPPNATFLQASILDLPLKREAFDIVFCHRVLQHTPNPAVTLAYILQFLKQDGAAFVHSYANTIYQRWRWKYALLPVTRRIRNETLYRIIKSYAGPLFRLTQYTQRTKMGRRFNYFFVPLVTHGHYGPFRNKSDEFLIEYAVHDTFDALSPRYDKPITARLMRRIADPLLKVPFEVFEHPTITLLRTIVCDSRDTSLKKGDLSVER